METQNAIPIFKNPLVNENVALTATATQLNVPPIKMCPVGVYTAGLFTGSLATAGAMVANYLYTNPFVVSTKTTFDRIAAKVTVASGAGTKIRLGIYYDSGNNTPGVLLQDAGTIDADNATFQYASTGFPITLAGGLYWVSVISDGTPTVSKLYMVIPVCGFTTDPGASGCYYTSKAYGALPNPHTAVAINWSMTSIFIGLRVASYP